MVMAAVTWIKGYGQCNELFFSEYLEGSSYNKALEVYNPASASKDLSPYTIRVYFNGATDTSGNAIEINLKGTIEPGGTYVLAAAGFDTSLLDISVVDSFYGASYLFNGDDAIGLFKDSMLIDLIGEIGIDPGTSFTAGNGTTVNHCLVRKVVVTAGAVSWAVATPYWDSYPPDETAFLGTHLSCCWSGLTLAKGSVPDTGGSSGAAWVAPSGGLPGYSYLWSNGSVDSFAENLQGGKYYSVKIIDGRLCTLQDSVFVDLISSFITGTPYRAFSINPNPAAGGDEVFVCCDPGAEVSMIDLMGKVVTAARSGMDGRVSLRALKPGVYFISSVINRKPRVGKLVVKEMP